MQGKAATVKVYLNERPSDRQGIISVVQEEPKDLQQATADVCRLGLIQSILWASTLIQDAYDHYNNHPNHVRFVQEIDYTVLTK